MTISVIVWGKLDNSLTKSSGVTPKTIKITTIIKTAIAVLITVFNNLNNARNTNQATSKAATKIIKFIGVMLPIYVLFRNTKVILRQ
ncbi:hypothetical protein, partial [Calothrix rhizosoleniae]|uniref:hypothetical protein n=1 Tax=Calothrix rhizosoleniae TaxID=888997 RepID=UPI001F38F2B5